MPFKSVYPPFALLKVDWISGEIPMVDPIAIRMKIQAFLAYRCRSKDEWPEGGVEGVAHTSEPDSPAFIVLIFCQSHSKATTHPDVRMKNDFGAVDTHIIKVDL
jgi:hypothetical protein